MTRESFVSPIFGTPIFYYQSKLLYKEEKLVNLLYQYKMYPYIKNMLIYTYTYTKILDTNSSVLGE